MAMEEERQREVGARIKELRGPKPQPLIADQVGVTLRAYQAWEAGGGIAWQNVQRLAEIFNVSENYLLYGAETPTGPETQLDRIEQKIEELLSRVPDRAEALERESTGATPPTSRRATGSVSSAGSARRSGKAP